jgi:hypothetical protein
LPDPHGRKEAAIRFLINICFIKQNRKAYGKLSKTKAILLCLALKVFIQMSNV